MMFPPKNPIYYGGALNRCAFLLAGAVLNTVCVRLPPALRAKSLAALGCAPIRPPAGGCAALPAIPSVGTALRLVPHLPSQTRFLACQHHNFVQRSGSDDWNQRQSMIPHRRSEESQPKDLP